MSRDIPPPSESAIHQHVISYLRVALPPGSLFWSTPNESRRSLANASRLKAQGMTAGVGDISLLIAPNGAYYELEVKSAIGRQTPRQMERQNLVREAGGRYAVVRSIEETHNQLVAWNIPVKARMQLK